MSPPWRYRRFATSAAARRSDHAPTADDPRVTSTSRGASASNAAWAEEVGLLESASRKTVSEDPLGVIFFDPEGPQGVGQRLLADHVPGLVVEKLFHLEGRLPRILNRELGPVKRRVLLVQLRRGVVLFLRVVEASEVHAE